MAMQHGNEAQILTVAESYLNDNTFKPYLKSEERRTVAFAMATASVTGKKRVEINGKKYTKEGYIVVREHVPITFTGIIKEKHDE